MGTRLKLIAEAGKQVSNPFLLCALISKRSRQLLTAGNTDMHTAQIVNRAFDELIAGALEFDCQPGGHRPPVRGEFQADRSEDAEKSLGGPVISDGPVVGEVPPKGA